MEQQITERTTVEELANLVEDYAKVQTEEARAKRIKEDLKGRIMEAFKITGMREFTTDTGKRARVDTKVRENISVDEARHLLSEEMFKKLVKETVSVILSVRQVKHE